jgi:hypothetical protein
MSPKRCPRCGAQIEDSAQRCASCERPVTLDLTARVPKREPANQARRAMLRDSVLLVGGIAGIVAASVSDDWWIAGSAIGAALVVRLFAQFW